MQDEKKFILLDILEQEYTDDSTGLKKPYYDIFIKKDHQNKVVRYRALNNEKFSKRLDEYTLLIGKVVNPIFDSKTNKTGAEITVVDEILAV